MLKSAAKPVSGPSPLASSGCLLKFLTWRVPQKIIETPKKLKRKQKCMNMFLVESKISILLYQEGGEVFVANKIK